MAMTLTPALHWKDRFRASGIHLALSLGVAALAGLLVFGLWYPYPFREISGGRELFLLVVSVDVVLGPLVTFAVFSRSKPWRVMRRDFVVIGLLQLAALSYGLWTVYVARPVHMVFEYHRFSAVHALDVPVVNLDKVQPGIDAMPLWGPTLLSLREFKDNKEQTLATLDAMAGVNVAARPELWQPYEVARASVLKAAKPWMKLKERFPAHTAMLDGAARRTGRPESELLYLPMVGRKTFWTVLVDPVTAQPLDYLPLDSF